MKKIIAWLLVLALTAAISIGATLAYLTDTDEDVNVMTLGKVKIDQLEYERVNDEFKDADATVQEFHDNKPLIPAVTDKDFTYIPGDTYVDWTQIGKDGYTSDIWDPSKINNEQDKMVFIKNKGDYDAFVRSVFAFEAGKYATLAEFRQMVHLNLNETDYTWEWVETPVTIGESTYFVATATYNKVLAPGALTEISLSQIALDKTATNADVEAFGDTYQILVKSQGIQADGFENAAMALHDGFGAINDKNIPWETDAPTKGSTVYNAVHYLNADVDSENIAAKVSNITFGLKKDHADIIAQNDGALVDVEQDVPVYAYYVPKGNNYDVYLLADDTIYAPANSNSLFANMKALKTVDTDNLDVSRVTDMASIFDTCTSLQTVDTSDWDTGNVTSLRFAFYGCGALTGLDVSGWDLGNVTDLYATFFNCGKLAQLDVSDWDTSAVTTLGHTFRGCAQLKEIDASDWNTGNVTAMQNLFMDCKSLETLKVADWNTSKVTDMTSTFRGCLNLEELDVSEWNTGNVTTLLATFQDLPKIETLDIADWNVSKVTNMKQLFNRCTSLQTVDLSDWDMGNVTNMEIMFQDCESLAALDVSQWDTGNVTSMFGTFLGCYALEKLDVSRWDVSKVTNFDKTFGSQHQNAGDMKLKKLDLSNWNPVSAQEMVGMFYGCGHLTELDLSDWNMPNLTNAGHLFADCYQLQTVDMSGWNTPSLISVDAMFNHCTALKTVDLSDLDTANVKEFSQMFEACYALEEIKGMENWDTSKGCTFTQMFSGCNSLKELDLSAFNTGNARDNYTDMNNSKSDAFTTMFSGVNSLEKLIVSDKISYLGNGNVTEATKLTLPAPKAKDGYIAKWQNVDTKETYLAKDIPEGVAATYVPYYEYIPSGATMKNALHYLNGDSAGTKITANVSSVTFGRMADYAGIVNTYTGVLADQEQEMPVYAYYVPNGSNYDVYILSEGDIYAPVSCYELFYNGEAMASMTTVNLSNLNTSRTTNMARMFRNCSALTTADLRGLDTGAVTDMSYLFYKCTGLQSVNAAGLKTGNVTTMKGMFYECLTVKSLNLTGWDTSNVTTTKFMFIRCRAMEELIGSGGLNFSSVTDMESMCEGLDSLVTLDATNWGCENVTTMRQMFGWALSMEDIIGIENWNVSKVTNMETMFFRSPTFKELDLSGWNTASLQNTTSMFSGCTALETVYVGDGWDMSKVTADSWMFNNCMELVGGQGTTVGAMKSYDATYAKADGGAEAPGYLTYKPAQNP